MLNFGIKKINYFFRAQYPLLFFLLLLFLLGYYLRGYNELYHYLPYSPYEAFEANSNVNIGKGVMPHFTFQISEYPTKIIFYRFFGALFGNFYIIYSLGFLAVYLLGREVSGDRWGGALAASVYALSPENFLYYTTKVIINDSGLCYVSILFTVFALLKFVKTKKNIYLGLYTLFALIALTSYHTGATALIMILLGVSVSLLYSNFFEKKIFIATSLIFIFYLLWLIMVDSRQVILIINATAFGFYRVSLLVLVIIAAFIALMHLYARAQIKLLARPADWWVLLIILLVGFVLIFSDFNFFGALLGLGVKNYYISPVTLNNYFAQIIITHFYVLFFVRYFIKRDLDINMAVMRGWLLGILGISSGLMLEYYYGRIPDYSFPLVYLFFGLYWVINMQYRKTVVAVTLLILLASQLVIFSDPFTMRRYYTKPEVDSAKNVIALGLPGLYMSDLRTAALFRYLGKEDVQFFEATDDDYRRIFYAYNELEPANINTYIVLSRSMENIVYSSSYETKPVTGNIFGYYDSHFAKVYDDGLMMVYNTYWREILKHRAGESK